MKISSLFLIISSICLVSGIFYWKNNAEYCVVGNWFLEIASTPRERAQGLMNREKLCEHCGMLFVFEDQKERTFWMKNTRIPLDMYFYDAEGKMVNSKLNMRPENETEKPMVFQSKPASYVLEVNAGASGKILSSLEIILQGCRLVDRQ